MSRKDVDRIICLLEEESGKELTLTKTRGKLHEYLEMTLDFSLQQQVRVSKQDYIKSIATDSLEDMVGVASFYCQ